MARRRKSKKQNEIFQTAMFFVSTIGVIVCLIIYLWVYTEIDESLLAIEIQNSTVAEISNEIEELKSSIEMLSRPDVISRKAKSQLGMVVAHPETLSIKLNAGLLNSL